MERVDPIKEATELGLNSAITLDKDDLTDLLNNAPSPIGIIEAIVAYAEQNDAVFNEQAGLMVLLEINEKQELFAVDGLANAVSSFLSSQP